MRCALRHFRETHVVTWKWPLKHFAKTAQARAEAVWLFAMRRRPLAEWLGGVPCRSSLAMVFWDQALIRVVSVGAERLCWPGSGMCPATSR